MGDRGRLVIPQHIRERHGLEPGTPLVLFDSDQGLVLMTRAQLKASVQADFRRVPGSPVEELLADRRAEAARP